MVGGVSVATSLLILLAFHFLFRRIVTPLREIIHATELFSAQERSFRIDDSYGGELTALARTFNQMAERVCAAHARLTETNAQLDAEVADRTRHLEIANRRLTEELAMRRVKEQERQEMTEKATAASEAKTIFLANMSHELRTPLNAIIGFSDILYREMFGPLGVAKYQSYAADIHESGAHLLSLINDILDIARIELGALPLRHDSVRLCTAVVEAADMLSGMARDKGVELIRNLDPSDLRVSGDQTRLRQIFVNVVGNAIKFTPSGGTVSISCASTPAGTVEVVVADSGIGMNEQDLERVFEPFAQANESFARKYEGVGLGLSLAKRLTESQNGSIRIESSIGVGTKVTICFPLEREPRLSGSG